MLSYDATTGNLKAASERVVDEMARAMSELQNELIKNPQKISEAKRKYENTIRRIAAQWEKDWKKFANNDLAKAYTTGIKEADLQIARVEAVNKAPKLDIQLHRELFEEMAENGIADLISSPSPLVSTPGLSRYAKNAFKNFKPHIGSYDVYRKAMYEGFSGTTGAIVRSADDLYKQSAKLIMDTTMQETSKVTVRQAARKLTEQIAKNQKLAYVTYANGAKVPIDSYSEMVARTMSQKAANEAKLNRFAEKGYDLVRLSSHFRACPVCTRYQGKVYSRSGKSKKYPPLSRATAGGMFHPNCLHTVSPYFEGISSDELRTSTDPAEQALIKEHGYDKANQIAYKAQQKQRALERQIRKYKREEILSVNADDGKIFHDKMLRTRQQLRNHLNDNPYLPRDYYREGVPGWKNIVGLSRADRAEITGAMADRAMAQAALAEPEISEKIALIAKLNSESRNFGWKFKLKGRKSTMRKITNDYRDKAGNVLMETITDDLGDMVRYTYIVDELDDYSRVAANVAYDMKAQGFENYKWKNYWDGEGYKGINSNWYYKGQRVEVQFHTPESFKVKEGIDTFTGEAIKDKTKSSHYWYEKSRISSDKAFIAECEAIMNDLWRPVKVPPGYADISLDLQAKIPKVVKEYEVPNFQKVLPRETLDKSSYLSSEHRDVLDGYVSDLMNRPMPFQNVDEAKSWLTSMGIEKMDGLEEIDLRVFTDIKPSMEMMYEEYPDLRYVTKNFSYEPKTKNMMEWEDGIFFGPSFTNYDNWLHYQLSLPPNSANVAGSAYDLTNHELTHGLQQLIELSNPTEFKRLNDGYDTVMKNAAFSWEDDIDEITDVLSAYAKSNSHEFMSEAVAQVYSGRATSEMAQKAFDDFNEIWKTKDEWLDIARLEAGDIRPYHIPNVNDVPKKLDRSFYKQYEIGSDDYELNKWRYKKLTAKRNDVVDDKVKFLLNRPQPFKTHAEARTWLEDLGIREFEGLEKMDLRAFVDIKPAYETMYKEFPDLYYVNNTFRVVPDDFTASASWRNGIAFRHQYDDYEKVLTAKYLNPKHTAGVSAYDTTVHELGHGIQDLPFFSTSKFEGATGISYQMRRKVTDILDDFDMKYITENISEYASTNLNELISESFSQYYGIGETSELANKIVDEYKVLMKNKDEWIDYDFMNRTKADVIAP